MEEKLGKRVTKQIIYLILLVFGIERKIIIEVFGASKATLCKYNAAIQAGKPETIFEQSYNRPVSELEKYRDELYADFEKNPPANKNEAKARIEQITGIKRSLPQISKFLKKGALKVWQ